MSRSTKCPRTSFHTLAQQRMRKRIFKEQLNLSSYLESLWPFP